MTMPRCASVIMRIRHVYCNCYTQQVEAILEDFEQRAAHEGKDVVRSR